MASSQMVVGRKLCRREGLEHTMFIHWSIGCLHRDALLSGVGDCPILGILDITF